jgi:hypothetical protein
MGWPHATRDLSNASDADLAAMREAAKLLMDHERYINPRVVTDLCLIREETDTELRKRGNPITPITNQHDRTSGQPALGP